jgi:hypothetical protein
MTDILVKSCEDFKPLQDGTWAGDSKYCNLSLECKQLGMKSDWYNFYNNETNEYEMDYFCTGCYIKEHEKGDDKEVS